MKIVYIGNNIFGQYAFQGAAEQLSAEFAELLSEEELYGLSDGSMKITDITRKLISENADVYVVDIDLFTDPEK